MKTTKLITVVTLVGLAFMASHATAQVQADGAAGTPLVLPRPDLHFPGNGADATPHPASVTIEYQAARVLAVAMREASS